MSWEQIQGMAVSQMAVASPPREKNSFPGLACASLRLTSAAIYFSSFIFQNYSRRIAHPLLGTSLVIIAFLKKNHLCRKHYLLTAHCRVGPPLGSVLHHPLYVVLVLCVKDDYFCVLEGIGTVHTFVIVC